MSETPEIHSYQRISETYKKHPIHEADALAKTFNRKVWPRTTREQDFFFTRVMFGLTDCWVWVGARDTGGYGVWVRRGDRRDKAHRVAWRLFNGPIPVPLVVMHKCDVRNCVNPEHLSLGTQAENVRDCVDKGRARSVSRSGEDNPASRLTAADVSRAKKLRLDGLTFKQIAKEFGVSTMTALRAIKGHSWAGHA